MSCGPATTRAPVEKNWRKIGPLKWTPLRRLGDPVDIADAVGFLASNEAQFINGQVLYVDGGLGGQGPATH